MFTLISSSLSLLSGGTIESGCWKEILLVERKWEGRGGLKYWLACVLAPRLSYAAVGHEKNEKGIKVRLDVKEIKLNKCGNVKPGISTHPT